MLITTEMLELIKKNPVLVLSGILALISCFVIRPDAEYLSYINVRVLAILMSLMLVVAVLLRIGTFDYLTNKLLGKLHTSRAISLLLTALSFTLAMLLTNDVTLVTLVPFAIAVLKNFNDRKSLMYTLILMTVAANLGSMLTPIGNPQNLYLYSHYKFALSGFIKLMLPYSALSLALIIIAVFILCKNTNSDPRENKTSPVPDKTKLIICIALFVLCVLAVADVINWILMFFMTTAVTFLMDKKAFKYVDFNLLVTFVFFFILTGNLGRIDAVYNTLSKIVETSPVIAAVISSQIISNVPAAMLLSAFTNSGEALVIGTNLGGLGTLIASMASLITYRFYTSMPNEENRKGMGYLPAFTIVNIVFLAALLAFRFLIR